MTTTETQGATSVFPANDWRYRPASECAARPPAPWTRTAFFYQIQLRSFTPEGTLAAAARRLPWVAATGADTVYLSPVTLADDGMDKAYWSPRQIRSGTAEPRNPYRVKDYYAIDPEYGDEDDFRAFVETAHSLGLRVLFDVVYYHCGPNAVFLKEHPEFVLHNTEGGIPSNIRWHFPPLDFARTALCRYLWDNLVHWVRDFDVDGFRCDVADLIPLDFWETARVKLDAVKKDVVLLAEGAQPENHVKAFDCSYCLPFYHTAVEPFMRGKADAAAFAAIHRALAAERPKGSVAVRYFENHDLVTDAGKDRNERVLGRDACEALIALCFALDGIPFVFNGQEIADASELKMFERSPIDWSREGDAAALARLALVRELAALRRAEPALQDTDLDWRVAEGRVLAFSRGGAGEPGLFFAGNYGVEPAAVAPPPGFGRLALSRRATVGGDGSLALGPHGFAFIVPA